VTDGQTDSYAAYSTTTEANWSKLVAMVADIISGDTCCVIHMRTVMTDRRGHKTDTNGLGRTHAILGRFTLYCGVL